MDLSKYVSALPFIDDLADQCVDHPGHDRVEPGGRLVEKDDLGLVEKVALAIVAPSLL